MAPMPAATCCAGTASPPMAYTGSNTGEVIKTSSELRPRKMVRNWYCRMRGSRASSSERTLSKITGRIPRWTSALTIAGAYIAGGFIPLGPYIFAGKPLSALFISIGVTLLALLIFGFVKGRFTGMKPLRSALQTALIGSAAAGAAFVIARLIA